MLLARRIVAALVAAYGGGWAARLVYELLKPMEAAPLIALFVVGTVSGAVIGWVGSRDLEPWTAKEGRDAVTGWGFVAGIVVVLPTLLLPGPWRVLAFVVVLALTVSVVVALRRRVVQA